MEICPVGDEFVHVDRQTNRRKLTNAFWNCANVSKNCLQSNGAADRMGWKDAYGYIGKIHGLCNQMGKPEMISGCAGAD